MEEQRRGQSGEFLISILLPELDGGILSMPAGVMGETEDGELPQLIPEKERIHTLGKRLDGLVNLQKKRNAEKKVAIIFYNYPPGRVMFSEEHFWILCIGFRIVAAVEKSELSDRGDVTGEATGGFCNRRKL